MFSSVEPIMSHEFININRLNNKINLGFFTSRGGISKGDFFSLNCSRSSKDLKKNIKQNIEIAKKKLKIESKKLKLVSQIHSNKIISLNKYNFDKNFYADGMITSEKNFALGVLTADCAPIFIYDINNTIICAIHSGWKGTLLNIISKGLMKIKNQGIKTNDMVAVVGPCLGFKNFEVDKKFKINFVRKDQSYSNFFKSKNKYKDLFNLRGLINFQLKFEGVKSVYNVRKDTYENNHIFFSHRRARHQNRKDTGRMINIISFKE